MAVSYIVALIVIVFLYVTWRVNRYFSFWEGQGIPYLTFTDYLVLLYDTVTKPYKVALSNLYKKYGRIFGSYTFNQPTLFIGDPELVKQVMVKDFTSFSDRFAGQRTGHKMFDSMVASLSGQEWKETRDIITPAFTSGKMRQMISIVEETSLFTVENFIQAAQQKEAIHAKELFGAYSMDIIARVAFATKLNSHKDRNSEFVKYAKEAFGPDSSLRFTLALMFPKIFKLFRIPLMPDYVTKFFEGVTKKVIEHRGEHTQNANDLLQLLLNARKEERLEKEKLGGKTSKEVLTMDTIIAQCVLFFVAGYDTTGTTLSLIAYHLALNPDAQEKLIQEIDKLDKNEGLTYERMNSMQYLDAVINETFRISGNIPSHVRMCTEETEVKGVKMKKGMLVIIPVDSMMNDPEYFNNPEEFKPERFLPENKGSIKPYTFIPFGEGPRHCLGMRLALMVIKVVIIKLFQRVRLTKCAETPVALEPLPRLLITHFKKPIKVTAIERK